MHNLYKCGILYAGRTNKPIKYGTCFDSATPIAVFGETDKFLRAFAQSAYSRSYNAGHIVGMGICQNHVFM